MTTTLELSPQTAIAGRRWIQWLNILGTAAALLLIYGFFCFEVPRSFATFGTAETILRQMTIVAIAAMGATLIIISGGIDLSVGSIIALTTVVIALLLKHGYGPVTASIGGVLAGCLCGLVNGALITGFRVVPFIVTLGTMGIIRGAAKGLANNNPVYVSPHGLDALTAALSKDQWWMLVPGCVWIMLGCVVVTALVLRYTRYGRHVVAIGSNEQTARLCGVPVTRVKILVYVLGGLFAGIAGVMQFLRLTIGDPTVADGLELDIIAAAVIGGASLAGGEGSAVNTLIGAAIMNTLRTGSAHMGWPNWRQQIITGVIIIIAVALDRLRQRKTAT